MNRFKKLISISILIILAIASLSVEVEAKKFDKLCLGKAKVRRASSFLGGDPDQPIVVGSKRRRRSSSVAVADFNGDGRPDLTRKRNSRKIFILPYIEQDNLYK
ncbi:MAG: hypothetical protein AB1631_19645 [Acidobacteriota bacterium]